MIKLHYGSYVIDLPHAPEFAVNPSRSEVSIPVMDGGTVRQILGGLMASNAAPEYKRKLPASLCASLVLMRAACSQVFLSVDDVCYLATWHPVIGTKDGTVRDVTIRFGIVRQIAAYAP
jgi:hypothetical protein